MNELKPCPFCGSKAEWHEYQIQSRTVFKVMCSNNYCDVMPYTDAFPSRIDASSAWNRRVNDDKP